MTSIQPFLIRAFYDWIVSNNLSPYILVNAKVPNVIVPKNQINPEGTIILNLSPRAVMNLNLNDTEIMFCAKFNGVETSIEVPIEAVQAIYAKETSQGMIFNEAITPVPSFSIRPADNSKKPNLTVVK